MLILNIDGIFAYNMVLELLGYLYAKPLDKRTDVLYNGICEFVAFWQVREN